jgi:hypothetical protein
MLDETVGIWIDRMLKNREINGGDYHMKYEFIIRVNVLET